MAIVPSYSFLVSLQGSRDSGVSISAVLFIGIWCGLLIPLSFFRGLKRGRNALLSYIKFKSLPFIPPSWLYSGIIAGLRGAPLPCLLIAPFVIAFPGGCQFPGELIFAFMLTPLVILLGASVLGVIGSVSLHARTAGHGRRHEKLVFSSGALNRVAVVIPFLIVIPVLVNNRVSRGFFQWAPIVSAARWCTLFFVTLCRYWYLQAAGLVFIFLLLLTVFRRLSAQSSHMFSSSLVSGTSPYAQLVKKTGYGFIRGFNPEESIYDAHQAEQNNVLSAGLLGAALEILFFIPGPVSQWDRFFFNSGLLMVLAIAVLLLTWPKWKLAQGYSSQVVMKNVFKVSIAAFFTAIIVMLAKHSSQGSGEFLMYGAGFFTVICGVSSLAQIMLPHMESHIDSPGGGALLEPRLDGFVLFLIQSVYLLALAGWATGVYVFFPFSGGSALEISWLLVFGLTFVGSVFFFVVLPLWIFTNRVGAFRYYWS